MQLRKIHASFLLSRHLKVTWAKVNANHMQGVEKYLSDVLDPVVGERFPN